MKAHKEKVIKEFVHAQQQLTELEEILLPESVEMVQINRLSRPSYSRRQPIPSLIRTLVRSLHEFDFIGGIIVNQKLQVIDGWHRVEIWKEMGNSHIPCLILDVSKEQERKLHLSLNRHIAQFNPADFGFTDDFVNFNLIEDFGFSKADLLPVIDSSEENSQNRSRPAEKGSRLIIALPEDYKVKLEKIKKQLPASTKSEALIKLINFYESSIGGL